MPRSGECDERVGSKVAAARSAPERRSRAHRAHGVQCRRRRLLGVPRYTSVLARALDGVSHEFPLLELVLVTTRTGGGDRATPGSGSIVHPFGLDPDRGALRLLAEQLRSAGGRRGSRPFLRRVRACIRSTAPVHRHLPRRLDHLSRHCAFREGAARVQATVVSRALTRAAAIVAVSNFAKHEAVRRLSVDPEKVFVVRSGPGLASSVAQGPEPNGRPYFLFVGNLTARKNVPFLIRAYERTDTEADLVLAGSPLDDAGAILAAVQRSPRRDRIRLLPAPDDAAVDRLYRGALGLLHPALYEGFGFTPRRDVAGMPCDRE